MRPLPQNFRIQSSYFTANKRPLTRADLVAGDKFLVTIKSVQETVKDFSRELGYQDNCSPLRADPGGSPDPGSEVRNLNLMLL